MRSSHGGDRYGREWVLDFSANLHPLGMPPQVMTAIQEGVLDCIHYPDPLCRDLRKALAQRDGVSSHQIVCGNGAGDLIYRLSHILQAKKALVTAPTFSEYEEALGQCEMVYYTLVPEKDFQVGEDICLHLHPDLDVVFLCSPNNPTGVTVSGTVVEEMARICKERRIYLVIDQCFIDFCPMAVSHISLLDNPYVVLLRAFTKSYGIPGIRLGYCLSGNETLLTQLRERAQPWSVSTLAQIAGIAACTCEDWITKGQKILEQERPRLEEGLKDWGATVWRGEGNYILFRVEGCVDLKEQCLQQGVLLRSCENYRGLGGEYYRIAIGTAEKNTRLLEVLQEVKRGNGETNYDTGDSL